jgi:hypothetical protein
VEIDTNVNIDVRPAAEVINERLNRLAAGAIHTAARLSQEGADVVDAEIVEETASATGSGSEPFNEELKDGPVDLTGNIKAQAEDAAAGSGTSDGSLKVGHGQKNGQNGQDGQDRPALPKEEK